MARVSLFVRGCPAALRVARTRELWLTCFIDIFGANLYFGFLFRGLSCFWLVRWSVSHRAPQPAGVRALRESRPGCLDPPRGFLYRQTDKRPFQCVYI